MGGITIASDELQVTVNPRVGGTITQVTHLGSGLSVLGKVPWHPVDAPITRLAARDEAEWLTRFTGGWPLLFPNGGDACTVGGTFHGFHGEASIAPWDFSAVGNSIRLRRRFFSVPVDMEREIIVERDLVIVRERLWMDGTQPVEVMWGHHATFGSDLLTGPVEITTGAKRVTVDGGYDPSANSLVPGSQGDWPMVMGKAGPADLSKPVGPLAAMAYMHDFDRGWATICRLDNSLAVTLSWDAKQFPCAWLWYELQGTMEAPWYGRGAMVGIEPSTTKSGAGINAAKQSGAQLITLLPGKEIRTELQLHVINLRGKAGEADPEARAVVR